MLRITLDLTDEASEGLLTSELEKSENEEDTLSQNQWLRLQNGVLGIQNRELKNQLEDCRKFIMGEKL